MLNKIKNKGQAITAEDIDIALQMLRTNIDSSDIEPLLSALEALKSETASEALQSNVIDAFHNLGIFQGAALTYAPYLNIFVSDDPFDD
ncbi:MAG: hypothetical protein OEY29_08215 [Gammaproteobacteria bacterium]|nr:hypothetical protein [Gammaproteobacteria bacterium]